MTTIKHTITYTKWCNMDTMGQRAGPFKDGEGLVERPHEERLRHDLASMINTAQDILKILEDPRVVLDFYEWGNKDDAPHFYTKSKEAAEEYDFRHRTVWVDAKDNDGVELIGTDFQREDGRWIKDDGDSTQPSYLDDLLAGRFEQLEARRIWPTEYAAAVK